MFCADVGAHKKTQFILVPTVVRTHLVLTRSAGGTKEMTELAQT